jgi:hypothetical protein
LPSERQSGVCSRPQILKPCKLKCRKLSGSVLLPHSVSQEAASASTNGIPGIPLESDWTATAMHVTSIYMSRECEEKERIRELDWDGDCRTAALAQVDPGEHSRARVCRQSSWHRCVRVAAQGRVCVCVGSGGGKQHHKVQLIGIALTCVDMSTTRCIGSKCFVIMG